jgi:hypothetical protein
MPTGWGFPFVRKVLEEFDVPVERERFRIRLKCDFLVLTYLIENACSAKVRFSKDEWLLSMYFRLVFLRLKITHGLRLNGRAAVLKFTAILEYFAYALDERRAWKALT